MTMVSLQSRVRRLDNARYKGAERPRSAVNLLTMHATASGRRSKALGIISWMNGPIDPRGIRGPTGPVSYHYLIDRDGTIYRMLEPKFTAYHAGVSAWPNAPRGRESVNPRAIGVAFVNDNLTEELTALQLESAEWLCRVLMRQYNISASQVVSHREVAPGRKTDPITLDMHKWRSRLAKAA